MGRIEKSIEIKASPEKVWEMLAFDRFWRTQANVKSVEYTSEAHTLEDKLRVGASARVTDTEGRQYDMVITESLENKKISSRSTNASLSLFPDRNICPGTKWSRKGDDI